MLRLKPLVETCDVRARGVPLHTRIESSPGVAPPHDDRPMLVFGHGYCLDERCWGFQWAALVSAGYRVLTWDHRGHAESGKRDSRSHTIDQLGSGHLAFALGSLE